MYLRVLFLSMGYLISVQLEAKSGKYRGRYSNRIPVREYNIIIPLKVNQEGMFLSHLIPHHYKRSHYYGRSEIDNDDKIHYRLPIEGEEHHLELWPNNNLMSPGMVIETRKLGQAKRKYKNFHPMQRFMNNVDIRKARDEQCHYKGDIRGHSNNSAYLSTCYGLSGLLRTKRGNYFVEPVVEHDPYSGKEHPHILYKVGPKEFDEVSRTVSDNLDEINFRNTNENLNWIRDTTLSNKSLCASKVATSGGETNNTSNGSNLANSCMPPGNSPITDKTPLNVEVLLVLDKTLLDYHTNIDVENYVLTLMNMAHNVFHDSSLGFLINLVVVRMIRLEAEDDAMNIAVTNDAQKSLDAFCDWQANINPADDCHPNHHDVAIIITRTNICYNEKDCGMLGISKQGGTCDNKLCCILCEDDGLKLGYVIAHELGHSLGIEHDDEKAGCNGTSANGLHTIMHPDITMKTEGWSSCSGKFLKSFIDAGFATCLLDEPADHDFPLMDVLPGVMYDGDFQCRMLIAKRAIQCYLGSTCETLNCALPGYTCLKTWTAPAPGTSCGEKMWCFHQRCEPIGERTDSVNGNWGEWSAWSTCSRTCGSGIAYQERQCYNPIPRSGGMDCEGKRRRHRLCNIEPCEKTFPTFRDMQCEEYNNWIFPETGERHKWKGRFLHDEDPCKLFCENENGIVVSLRSTVTDGTACMQGIRDICVAGLCTEIPCDLDLESKAVEDRCGECHGDGLSCTVNEGLMFFEEDPHELKLVLHVPVNSRNIKAKETEPTESLFIVSKENSKEPLNNNTLGMFSVPGSRAWIGMIKVNQETLLIPGPVSEALVIWAKAVQKVSIQYSLALSVQRRKQPHFYWENIDWNECSAFCGIGTQMSVPKCVEEEAGLVEDKYCKDIPKPKEITRQCENGPCIPRWYIGEWGACKEINKTYCERVRVVHCVKPTGEGEGETDVVSDDKCGHLIPDSTKKCPCDFVVHKRNLNQGGFLDTSFDQNRNPDEDPDENILEILGFGHPNQLKKHRHHYYYPISGFPYIKRSCIGKNESSEIGINVYKTNSKNETYKNETYNNQNETFKNQNETYSNQNEAFKNQNETFKNQNETYKNQNETYKNQNETFKNQNETFGNQNETFRKHVNQNETKEDRNENQITKSISRGQTIIDKEGLNEVNLQVLLEKDESGNIIKPDYIPSPNKSNDNVVNIKGIDSLRLVEKVQEMYESGQDFSNRTKKLYTSQSQNVLASQNQANNSKSSSATSHESTELPSSISTSLPTNVSTVGSSTTSGPTTRNP